jgi:hypothetical protein
MKRTWLYLKLAVLLLSAVMMYSNVGSSRVFAEGCSGGCDKDGERCVCQTASACGCFIQSGEKGCGVCSGGGSEELQ